MDFGSVLISCVLNPKPLELFFHILKLRKRIVLVYKIFFKLL